MTEASSTHKPEAEAPPAYEPMQRFRAEENVGGMKLDASTFDGCWLLVPDHKCCCVYNTHLHFQKHIDNDRIVAMYEEPSVLCFCLPCACPCVTALCCPHCLMGLRVPDTADGEQNSFDFMRVRNAEDGGGFDPLSDHRESFHCDPFGFPTSVEAPIYYPQPHLVVEEFIPFSPKCNKTRVNRQNEENTTWQYIDGSAAVVRPTAPRTEYLPAWCAPKVKEWKAVHCASWTPSCCFPDATDLELRLLAAYYYGVNQKDDRPLTAAEQKDEEACGATFAGALEVANIPLLRRYRAVVGELKPEHAIVLAANGHFEALKWARDEGVAFTPDTFAAAALSGKLEILKYCTEIYGAVPGREKLGDLEYCKAWFPPVKKLYDTTLDEVIVLCAVRSGSFECVEYCRKTLELPWHRGVVMVASRTSPEMLRYCLENSAPASTGAIVEACRRTDLEVVKVFAESSHPFPGGEESIELCNYSERATACKEISRVCARKGFSVSYRQYNPDYY